MSVSHTVSVSEDFCHFITLYITFHLGHGKTFSNVIQQKDLNEWLEVTNIIER